MPRRTGVVDYVIALDFVLSGYFSWFSHVYTVLYE
jgi:hypothetical protein